MKVNNVPDDVPKENTFYGVMYSILLQSNFPVTLKDYNKSNTTIFIIYHHYSKASSYHYHHYYH